MPKLPKLPASHFLKDYSIITFLDSKEDFFALL